MNKLELINNSVNEIREILGVECAPVEALPEMIRQIAEDPSRSGLSTIFVWSTDDAPGDPNSNKLDVATGILSDLSDEWSQDIQNASTYSLRRVEDPKIWMSSAIFDPVGTRLTKWTTPVNIKGVRGENGIQGEQGERGEQGEMGPRGENASSYRTVSVYTMTNTEDAPGKPFGGSWDMATNTVNRPSANNAEWYLNPDEIYPKKTFLWMSQGTFNEEGDLVAEWCEPFRMTGDRGLSGADGRVIEFIYRLLPSMEVYNALKISLENKKLSSPNVDDFIPEVNDSLNIGTQWKDQPVGITEDWPIEAACSRMRKSVSESWSEWSPCIIWSKWGEDGTDGDGVEYIYLVTPDTTNEGDKMTSEYVENLFMPNPKDYLNDPRYQEDEFCFNGNWGYDYDWTDEPRDVGPGEPMEWVSVRKKRKNDEGKVVWGAFSKPALWAKFAEDGYSYFTSFVFRRSETPPLAPEGGSFNDPKPIGNLWEDTVPVKSDSQKGPVWMSTRIFYAGGDFDSSWSTPKQMTSDNDFQVVYTAAEKVKGISKFTGNYGEWIDYQLDTYGMTWEDHETINDPKWMATATSHNDIWSDWVVTRIKGEKGEKGDPGSSVQIKGKISTLADLKEMWNDYVAGNVFDNPDLDAGDGYYIESGEGEGLLYVYSGGYDKGETDTNFDSYWQGVELKGEPGKSQYIHIKYSNDKIKFTDNNGESSGKYIGMYVDSIPEDSNNFDDYLPWRKFEGNDGWGYEYIYQVNNTGVAPQLPNSENIDGAIPTGWTDNPSGISESNRYEYMCHRVKKDGKWSEWIGEKDKNVAVLWAKWGDKGEDGAGVEYIFARGTVDTTNWSSAGISAPNNSWAYDSPISPWYDESKGVDLTNIIEWVSSRRKAQGSNTWTNWSTPAVWARYSKDGDNGAPGEPGAPGRGITGVEERYLLSKDQTGITVNTSGWSANVQTPTADQPYLWNYEIINYTSGEPTKTTPAVIGMYGSVGAKGDTGRGISNITEYYQLTTTNSQPSSGSFDNESVLIPTSTERYLWNKEVISYTDGTKTESITLLCVYGEKGNTGDKGDSVTIISTEVSYAQGSNGKDVPSESSWNPNLIEVPKGYYLWTRTIVRYSDGNSTTTYSSAYSGSDGIPGESGKDAPATPFAGNYNSSKAYYGNDRRTDVVRYNGKYYVTNQNHLGNDPFVGRAPSGTGADNDYWLAFGDSFDNIATGYLFAEAGHIEDLTVNAVKTYDPNTNQYIVIDDGTMTVYDKKENGNIKLSITGDKLGTIPNSSNGNFEWNPFVETSFSSDNIEDIYVEQEFTFTTTASPAIIRLDPKMTRNLWAWGEGGYSAMSDVVTLMSIYIDDEFKTEIDITDFGIPESGIISSTGLRLQEKTVDLLDAHQSSFNFAVNSAGSHVLKVSLQIQWMDNGSQGAFFTYKDTVSGSYTITYPMNRIAMGSNGLNVVFQDSSNKVQFVSDSNGNLSDLTLESTNYGVQVLPNGLKMKLNGTWYTASRDANGFLKLS